MSQRHWRLTVASERTRLPRARDGKRLVDAVRVSRWTHEPTVFFSEALQGNSLSWS